MNDPIRNEIETQNIQGGNKVSDTNYSNLDDELFDRSLKAIEESKKMPVYGKVTYIIEYRMWEMEPNPTVTGKQRRKKNPETGNSAPPLTITRDNYDKFTKDPKTKFQCFVEFIVTVSPKKFNPDGFETTRKVPVIAGYKNRETKEWIETDWEKTLFPSINRVFGNVSTFRKMANPECETYIKGYLVPPAKGTYSTIEFDTLYKSVAECAAAWQASGHTPTPAQATNSSIPPELIAKAQNLRAAVSNDRSQFDAIVQSDPALNAIGSSALWDLTNA